ncbi:hypothetical protein GOQ27_08390 [Clostridium sp. D2Q-11]|uniref:Lipoprotein n=1 Tax=Anaeromonas frigoriresistens TaxID=2683708 RepID=A0A942UX13_9FIRM|nr:hypothetical protein [Anaeromonas frigoriresistens]MBS4538481.1 hypothetical protein [Anaeromonas frigoriresistens]
MRKIIIMLIIISSLTLSSCKTEEDITTIDSIQNLDNDVSELTKKAKRFNKYAAMLDGFAIDYETYEENIKPIVEENFYEDYVNIEFMSDLKIDSTEQGYSYSDLKGLSKERLNEISKLVQKHTVEDWRYYNLKLHFHYSKPYKIGDYSYVFFKYKQERLTGDPDKPEKSGDEGLYTFVFKNIDGKMLIVDDSESIEDIDFKIDEKDVEFVEELELEIDYKDFSNNFFK